MSKSVLYNSVFPANTAAVELTKGEYALVDVDDLPAITRHSWHVSRPCKRSKATYAYGKAGDFVGKARKDISLHRFLFRLWGISAPADIDHVNGDGLDCRRVNLDPKTRSANRLNSYGHRLRAQGIAYRQPHPVNRTPANDNTTAEMAA